MNPYFMEKAVRLSYDNVLQGKGGPFGAVIVKDGNIISTGKNSVVQIHDPTAHAEIMAIREACQKLSSHHLEGCEIYSSTEPCPMCYAAIRWAKIKTIYYANTRHDAADIGFNDKQIYDEIENRSQGLIHCKPVKVDAKEAFQLWTNVEKVPY